uniref:Uncharacterized protein n=1 Tax=Anguilla anguilla TaxID=7936 RepID=A0A0E9WAL5_ANGAN
MSTIKIFWRSNCQMQFFFQFRVDRHKNF